MESITEDSFAMEEEWQQEMEMLFFCLNGLAGVTSRIVKGLFL